MAQIQHDSYSEKERAYFRNVRKEILPHLTPDHTSFLEVGCGEGATLRYLRDFHNATWVGGIEINPAAARVARNHLNWISSGDIESPDIELPDRQVDVLLCLDVLEHLRDPWRILRQLVRDYLKPGGLVLAILPNIRNWRILNSLVFGGDWTYTSVGILDHTHLRFFTQRTGRRLLNEARLVEVESFPLVPKRMHWAEKALRATGLGEFASSQILFRAYKGVEGPTS